MTLDMDSHETSSQTHTRRHGRGREHHGLVGPVILIAIGAIFLVAQFVPAWGVGKTWPIVLIAIGLTKLVESALARRSVPRS